MHPFALAFDALLRPARFAAYLEGGWRAIARAGLATLLWVGAGLAFVALILPQLISLGARSIVASLALAPTLALFAAGLAITPGSSRLSVRAHTAFWLLRCQLAITPLLALGLALAYSTSFAQLQTTPAFIAILLLLFGAWCGGGLAVALVMHKQREQATAVRWLLSAGCALIGALLWYAPTVRIAELRLLLPFCAGIVVGLLRPISYLCAASLSVGLALAARLGRSPLRLLAFHPALYDHMCLLPLPGLSGLLQRACAVDLDAGCDWLLRVAQHLSQARAAERAIQSLVRQGRLVHPLLFWLSTDAAGAALLARMSEQSRPARSLIHGYAALAAVATPEAWPAVLARQHDLFAQAVALPGGQAVLALLEAGLGTLTAERWPMVGERLRAAPAPSGVEIDPFWNALELIRGWTSSERASLIAEHAQVARTIDDELHDLDGWPSALLATVNEHMRFLIEIERRRGAWLA